MLGILEVVPAALVEHLTQDLDGRLSSVLLYFGHVQIVDEDNNLVAETGSENTVSSLVELAIDDVLNLVAMGLCRETDLNRLVLGNFQSLVQLVK